MPAGTNLCDLDPIIDDGRARDIFDKLHSADLAAGPESREGTKNAWRIRLRTRPRSSSVIRFRRTSGAAPTSISHSMCSLRRIKLQISKLAARRSTPPTLISSKMQPHMHARGVRLDMIVERADGSRETLIDVPYDFTNQITYETDMVLKPGDSLVTTCHYQNDTNRVIMEGSSTEEEIVHERADRVARGFAQRQHGLRWRYWLF
jgi:hypothetical protein